MLKKVLRRIGRKIIEWCLKSELDLIQELKKEGVEIGQNTIFFDPKNTIIDIQNPKLLKIGSNVRITSGVKILTHDFSWSVVAYKYGECVGGVAPVIIGNNVFLGMNSIILKGTSIGDNVIVGAGSVVCGKLDSDYVYAGIPAKKIMSLEDYYKKKKLTVNHDINRIASFIDNERDIIPYLREYSCYINDMPEEMKRQIMRDSGNYENCERFYAKEYVKYDISDFLNEVYK